MFKDDPARVRPFVPERYELGSNGFFGPGVATIIAAVLVCEEVSVNGSPPARTVLTLIAVQIVAEPSGGDPLDASWDLYNRSTLNFLPSSSWYLISSQTDNGRLAGWFQEAGLPVAHVPGLAYQNDYGGSSKSDQASVPLRHSGYRLSTTTMLPDSFIHNHDWFFWYELPTGRTGFLLHLDRMADSSCGYHTSKLFQSVQPSCASVLTAQPGGQVANFFGAPVRETSFAFNHPPSSNPGYISLPTQRSLQDR